MAIKKFTPKAAKSTKKPIEFEIYDEKFTAIPHLQGITLISFIEATSGMNEESDSAGLVSEIMPFFEAALEPDSYERFEALTKSHDKILELEDLMDILSYLVENYTGNPSSGSSR